MNPRIKDFLKTWFLATMASCAVLIAVGVCVIITLAALQEVKKLLPKPAVNVFCSEQAGKIIYLHRKREVRCIVQV